MVAKQERDRQFSSGAGYAVSPIYMPFQRTPNDFYKTLVSSAG